MRRNTILALGCLLGLIIILGQVMARPTSAQPDAGAARKSGRYQISLSVGGVCVIDTATGHCWMKDDLDDQKWTDLGSPAEPKKE
jgi:hypothetical protein